MMSGKNKTINQRLEQEEKIQSSRLWTNSFYTAAKAISSLHGHGHRLDLVTLVEEFIKDAKKVTEGDIKGVEEMLMLQAKTLDFVFYDALSHLSDLNMINQIEVFSNIAFKAQAQSRKTLAILAELKHPRRTTFIKQQNNAINQQVNNGLKSNLEKSEKVANELLSEAEHASLDFRRTTETIGINQGVEAMEKLNRGKDD